MRLLGDLGTLRHKFIMGHLAAKAIARAGNGLKGICGSVVSLAGLDSLLVLFLLLRCDLLLVLFLQLHASDLHRLVSAERGSNRRCMLALFSLILLVHQFRHKLIGDQCKHQDKA